MSEVEYDDYRRGQWGVGSGYDGPPVGVGYFPPEFRIPVAPRIPVGTSIPPPLIFPTVRVEPPAAPAGDSPSETSGDSELPETVIDPEAGVLETVYEHNLPFPDVPGGIYQTNRGWTDWDAVYNEYVILNPPIPTEEDVPFHDSIDWGEVAGGILGGVLDPFGVGAAARAAISGPQTLVPDYSALTAPRAPVTAGAVMPANGCPPTGPKYAKICLATNVISPLRRRRRRRLLTSSDIKDLSALKSIVGGAALQAAVTQAVRR